jgi:glycosyltransferase involved in cell wall biosynthesis
MLAETLRALRSAVREPDELWVVDDASTDNSAAVAKEFGARVLSMERNVGPSACRNRAALLAESSILVFFDADTWVHADTLQRLEAHLLADPGLTAVIGAYDDAPHHRGLVSQCRNLSHCYMHRSARSEALTFWSGCGAVRRDAFLRAAGFDERYRRPSIEDIEFGYRMTSGGERILLDSSIVVKHAKHWTIGNAIVTDIWDRGIPWVILLIKQGKMPDDLNISVNNRLSTAIIGVTLLCLVASFHSQAFLAASLVLVVIALLLHADMFRFVSGHKLSLLPVSLCLFLLVEVCNLVAIVGGILFSLFGARRGNRTSCIMTQQTNANSHFR